MSLDKARGVTLFPLLSLLSPNVVDGLPAATDYTQSYSGNSAQRQSYGDQIDSLHNYSGKQPTERAGERKEYGSSHNIS